MTSAEHFWMHFMANEGLRVGFCIHLSIFQQIALKQQTMLTPTLVCLSLTYTYNLLEIRHIFSFQP